MCEAKKIAITVFIVSIFVALLSSMPAGSATTIYFSDGFESGNFSAWTGKYGSPTIQSKIVQQGTNAAAIYGKSYFIYKTFATSQNTVYFRIYLYINSFTKGDRDFAKIYGSGGIDSGIVQLAIDETGSYRWKLFYRNNNAWYSKLSTDTFNLNTWYSVEVKLVVSGSGQGESRLYINGNEKITASGLKNNDRGNACGVLVGASSFQTVNGIFDSCISSDNYIGPEELSSAISTSKTVYVVTMVDAEMWGAGHSAYIGSSNFHPTIDLRAYASSPPSTVSQVMDNNFRSSLKDSFGNTFKITWFAEMDYLMSQGVFIYADGASAGVSGYTAISDALAKNWGTQIKTYGDCIEYHHHFMIYNCKWQRYDSGPDAGYGDYQMYALDKMIIDNNIYPVCFDAGWGIMPPVLSNWLDQWLPFDYTYLGAIPQWYPIHSSSTTRWAMQTDVFASQSGINAAFETAKSRGTAIYCFTMHDRENMAGNITAAHNWLVAASAAYPDVSFQYVTAANAIQLALGWADFSSPTFTISPSGNNYIITANEPLWANHPYVALKYSDGTYTHGTAVNIGLNTWILSPQSPSSLAVIGVAASDLFGNSGVSVLNLSPTSTLSSLIGRTDAGNWNSGWDANTKTVSRFFCDTSGKISKAYANVRYQSSAGLVKFVIYTDSNGVPGALLGVSNEKTTGSSAQLFEFSFSTPVSVTAGNYYWLGIIAGNTKIWILASNTRGQVYWNIDAYSDGPTSLFGTSNVLAPREFCVYGIITQS
jgi:hypothetical protein